MFIYHHILGVDPKAGDREIRDRYLALVKQYPPERSPEDFMRINRAYERIKDNRSRIRANIMGLTDYRVWSDALDDLAGSIRPERKSPGLAQILEVDGR